MAGISIRFKDGNCASMIQGISTEDAKVCLEALVSKRPPPEGEYVLVVGGKVQEKKKPDPEPVKTAPPPPTPTTPEPQTRRILKPKPKKKGRW